VVVYDIAEEKEEDAKVKADSICVEQSVEVPPTLIEGTWIERQILGRVEEIYPSPRQDADAWRVRISFPDALVGSEMSQLMNIIFGLSSVQSGVQLVDLEMSPGLANAFQGPRFGIHGVRQLVQVPEGKPLMSTALKPLGRSTEELAQLAYEFARSGALDIIKDDDGLSDQIFSPFEERVVAVAAAIKRGSEEVGKKVLYAPCLNAPAEKILERAKFAKEAGAGAVLMLPGITGFDSMKALADDPSFDLPILCHPSLLSNLGGSNTPKSPVRGFSHSMMYGVLPRLAGADVSIFLNKGGRFNSSQDECDSISEACGQPLGHCRPMMPCPAGGMTLQQEIVDDMLQQYGADQMFLVGGSLYTAGDRNVTENSRVLAQMSGRSLPPLRAPGSVAGSS